MKFSSYHTKWRFIMTAFPIQNAVLIKLPEGGQIGQKWAKFRQFYKLCLISQKLSDEFSSYHTKWRVIMTACSSQNAILIESPQGWQNGRNFANCTNFAKFLKNYQMNFLLIAVTEGSSWPLSLAKTLFWLNSLKVGLLGKNGRKFANFTNFA